MSARALVFVGPTLRPEEVRRLLPGCELRPPAQQGDVWRALVPLPRVIVLLDGVFESAPSVWHRELSTALECGVTVFGASSMGALRAVELAPFGMIGVGQIFRAFRDGVLVDDSEVALLHASAEHGHRPLTLPLVAVRHAAARAVAARVLTPKLAHRLVEVAAQIYYQERHWPGVLRRVEAEGSGASWKRFATWRAAHDEDPKAIDARECLGVARAFLRSRPAPPDASIRTRPSSLVRRRKLLARNPELAQLEGAANMDPAARSGLRRALLASWARTLGLSASPRELHEAEDAWLAEHGVSRSKRSSLLAAFAMDSVDAQRLFEERALEQKLLESASHWVPDGPSRLEAIASELRTGSRSPLPKRARR